MPVCVKGALELSLSLGESEGLLTFSHLSCFDFPSHRNGAEGMAPFIARCASVIRLSSICQLIFGSGGVLRACLRLDAIRARYLLSASYASLPAERNQSSHLRYSCVLVCGSSSWITLINLTVYVKKN